MLLSDVLIIDATDRLGWLAGRVLADLGADVIKIETPGSDRGRADWRAFNVNKRTLELDLQASADRARFEDLLRAADICLLTPSLSSAHLDPHARRRFESQPRHLGGRRAVRVAAARGSRPRALGGARRRRSPALPP